MDLCSSVYSIKLSTYNWNQLNRQDLCTRTSFSRCPSTAECFVQIISNGLEAKIIKSYNIPQQILMHKEVSTAPTSLNVETFSFWKTMKQNRRVHYLHKLSCPTDDEDPLPRRKTARIWSKSHRSYNAEIENLFRLFYFTSFFFSFYQTRKVRRDQGGAAWWVVSIFSTPGVQAAVCGLELSFSNSTPRVGRRDLRRSISSRCCTVAWW